MTKILYKYFQFVYYADCLGVIKRPRVSNEQDLRKPSPIQSPPIITHPGPRTLRPRQSNNTTPNALPSPTTPTDPSSSLNLLRQSSSSSTSSNLGITSMQLRSSHVCFFHSILSFFLFVSLVKFNSKTCNQSIIW